MADIQETAGRGDNGVVPRAGSKISGSFFICRNFLGQEKKLRGTCKGRSHPHSLWIQTYTLQITVYDYHISYTSQLRTLRLRNRSRKVTCLRSHSQGLAPLGP